jgi:ubiquinone/menaquinone biosynthesis C-methylase UbiE
MHHDIAERTATLALRTAPSPRSVLDVGCGTGYLLRRLARGYPDCGKLEGIDAAPSMIQQAEGGTDDARLGFRVGVAEDLPYPDESFDLVVSSTSFDHWSDQQTGLQECRRVLSGGGHLVLVDQFSNWLLPTLAMSRRGKARTKRRADRLLAAAGFHEIVWHDLYASIIKAGTATA